MGKLVFKYGTMNSSKAANLLMCAHNYRSSGKKILLMKPEIDSRFGDTIIKSRAIEGVQANVIITSDMSDFSVFVISSDSQEISCLLIDEAQFLSEVNVDGLRKITHILPVICYGLRTDYKSRLFPGSKRLLELADTIEEIKTICVSCNKKAIINSKFIMKDDVKVIIYDGSSDPELGAEDKYQALCFECWHNKKL